MNGEPEQSLFAEPPSLLRSYLGGIKAGYEALGRPAHFERQRLAGADITVTGVPEQDGELPLAVFLVGTGHMFGDWDLDDGFELAHSRASNSWETVVVLDFGRRYDCVIVAVYRDKLGVLTERANSQPLHSFVVNEGVKQQTYDFDSYDSWDVNLKWNEEDEN